MQTDRWTDERTHTTKLRGAFREHANTPDKQAEGEKTEQEKLHKRYTSVDEKNTNK
jgi:hypothetical protein